MASHRSGWFDADRNTIEQAHPRNLLPVRRIVRCQQVDIGSLDRVGPLPTTAMAPAVRIADRARDNVCGHFHRNDNPVVAAIDRDPLAVGNTQPLRIRRIDLHAWLMAARQAFAVVHPAVQRLQPPSPEQQQGLAV